MSILAVCLLCGCEAADYYTPPVATSAITRAQTGRDVDFATLQRGRALFAHRCIQCHTAPSIWYYRAEDWPSIVNSMAHRASLKPAERDAIVAYILAVRGQL
ncbi:MAG: cytochrome c [Chthoniobacterales bacterium]